MADVVYYGIGFGLVALGLPSTAKYIFGEMKSDFQWHRIMAANKVACDDIERRGSRRRHPTAHRVR